MMFPSRQRQLAEAVNARCGGSGGVQVPGHIIWQPSEVFLQRRGLCYVYDKNGKWTALV